MKDKIKSIRSGFYSFKVAESFMNLRHIIHNFVNLHQQLEGKTPAEKAGIKLKLGRTKLIGLIKYIAENSRDD